GAHKGDVDPCAVVVEHLILVANHRAQITADTEIHATRLLPAVQNAPLPLDLRKLIGRIACRYLTPGCVINLGTGIPNDVI
ncbi:hypothetical protein GJD58_28835, partial [Klebsiella pneumoniae]|nr:hypothetical protein [Klebsiella pneumoniae]